MPPVQCPRCGRFLKRSFVEALDEAPAACPGCGAELTPDDIGAGPPDDAGPPDGTDPLDDAGQPEDGDAVAATGQPDDGDGVAAGQRPAPPAHSVRPPDLEPEAVQNTGDDVLHGWDAGTDTLARWQADRRPFPVDTVVVGSAAVSAAIVGGLLARRRGDPVLVGVGLGLVGGAIAAGVSRRIWRLEG